MPTNYTKEIKKIFIIEFLEFKHFIMKLIIGKKYFSQIR